MTGHDDSRLGKELSVVPGGSGKEGRSEAVSDGDGEAGTVGGLVARGGSLSLAGDLEAGGFRVQARSGSVGGGGLAGAMDAGAGDGDGDGVIYGGDAGLVGDLAARCDSLSLAGDLETGGFNLPGEGGSALGYGCFDLVRCAACFGARSGAVSVLDAVLVVWWGAASIEFCSTKILRIMDMCFMVMVVNHSSYLGWKSRLWFMDMYDIGGTKWVLWSLWWKWRKGGGGDSDSSGSLGASD